ncbi:Heat stress transcription factor B-3 [Dionaea muscipula]
MLGLSLRGLSESVTRPSPFLIKTYMSVDDPATDGVISWNTEGTAVVVRQPVEFARSQNAQS